MLQPCNLHSAESGEGKANRSSSRERLSPSSRDEDEMDDDNADYEVRRSCDTSEEAAQRVYDKNKPEAGKHSKKYEHTGKGKQKLETNSGKGKRPPVFRVDETYTTISDVEKVNFKKKLGEMHKTSTKVASTAEIGFDNDLERPERWRPKKQAASGMNKIFFWRAY
ncbi:hypothetical protein MPTK1_6g12420 [Marchantia polymorpha subsp. ruderalis]|uniref:Uncharacterized protein n=2 Tax=Marchantia polymorpha TaxID=3197 RepID=A0AAF6BR81_MARPO|nr:hypothetical protein MARPO_0059s0104 [Marchantia polymorpha]BBN14515.1 hypothetical protein Mp_6g12420 [Marchantia polymorpha subsp. ruderalis]|eukprot:PTQ37204.1 hypothetical protein MARPO_0059s0104 [Marchantia polymorpha]